MTILKFARVALVLGMLLMAAGALAATAQSSLPAAGGLHAGWNRLEPEGAVCANGEPYAFFVRPGDPDKLMIYFQGGGACWNRATCGVFGPYKRTVGDAADEAGASGIADFSDPRNPVADFTTVLVPYCSADVHTGSRTVTFDGQPPLTVRFHGYDNATAVLDWTTANYPDARQLFVTGTSAGSYGALFNAPRIFDAYPDAEKWVLGDAGVGVTPGDWGGFDVWGLADHLPEGAEASAPEAGITTGVTSYTALTYPDARVAHYTSAADSVQMAFYALMGGRAREWTAGMRAELAPLESLDNVRIYIAPGASHGILPGDAFYTMSADGVPFADWLTDWLAGEPVESVLCAACS
ncbi:MAG: esterase [Anaerolineae bacterium]|nr:esterase [Anaerolineae bacterium]